LTRNCGRAGRSSGRAGSSRAVLERDLRLCQGCRQRPATQVHHQTYRRVGREMLFDLVAVCDECHDAIHEGGDEGIFQQ